MARIIEPELNPHRLGDYINSCLIEDYQNAVSELERYKQLAYTRSERERELEAENKLLKQHITELQYLIKQYKALVTPLTVINTEGESNDTERVSTVSNENNE